MYQAMLTGVGSAGVSIHTTGDPVYPFCSNGCGEGEVVVTALNGAGEE